MRNKKSGKRKPLACEGSAFSHRYWRGYAFLSDRRMQIIWWARLRIAIKEAQPVVEWSPAPSGVETECHMDWADYLRDEAAKYRQLAKSAEDLSIKQELLDLAAVCEEAADNIEDRMPGG